MPIARTTLAACLAACLAAGAAQAATISFVQRDFAAGGELGFTITGTDLNADGYLERANFNPIDEITGFTLSFTGNPLIAPFTLGLADLLILDISLDTRDFLDPRAILFAGDFTVAYITGAGAGTDCQDAFFRCGVIAALETDSAGSPPVAVPAPAGLGLFGLGLAAMVGLRRRP